MATVTKKKPAMKITLVVDTETLEKKTYQEKFLSGLAFRKCLAFGIEQEKSEEQKDELQQMDELVEFVATLFSSEEVTAEAIWGGLSFDEVADVCGKIVGDILTGGEEVEPGK